MKPHPFFSLWPILFVLALWAAGVEAAPVSRVEVRIVTGNEDLRAGSYVELRIYETGRSVRHLPVTHGEDWPRHSTHLIPLTLAETLDPRRVVRFSLYYRAAGQSSPDWQIVAANVDLVSDQEPSERLLEATLSGVIASEGELATSAQERHAPVCASDADCDDKRTCNGRERCAPHTAGADARGCVKGTPVICPVNQVCGEGQGCRGPESLKPMPAPPPTSAPVSAPPAQPQP